MIRKFRLIGCTVALATALGASSVYGATPIQGTPVMETPQEIFVNFETWVAQPESLDHALDYLLNNIDEVAAREATLMTLHLENAQQAYLPTIQERIFPEDVQAEINAAYSATGSLTYTALLGYIDDADTLSALTNARDTGYKIMTSEGMYYPAINYITYMRFRPYVTADIYDYINCKVKETYYPAMNDGALAISWIQLLDRAVSAEQFLKDYPNSNRAAEIQAHYRNLVLTVFYGLNNTPLFDYETRIINADALDAYVRGTTNMADSGSAVIATLTRFLEVVSAADYRATAEVDAFLKENVPTGA